MSDSRAHAPRPIDLVALIAFDDAVCENQAVTRERLARPDATPHALNAAIEQWLVRRRHMWIDVRGRQINGIATARTLSADDTWVIDTLVDASDSSGGTEGAVVDALLEQALQAATQAGVTRVLLRTAADAAVLPYALRNGFKLALSEQLWSGDGLRSASCTPEGVVVRDATDGDAFELFQLYNRALPIEARQALALTLHEWEGIQERRWLGRNAREWVAEQDGRITASLRLSLAGDVAQFDLLAAPPDAGPDAPPAASPDASPDASIAGGGAAAAEALLDVAADQIADRSRVLVLAPRLAAPLERLLAARGLQPGNEYALLSRRTAKPLPDRARVASEVAIPRGV